MSNCENHSLTERFCVSEMTEQDLDAVVSIENRSFPDPWTREGFKDSLSQKHALMLTARCGQEIVGYCCMYYILDEGEIINVAIDKCRRGLGFGRQMLEMLLMRGKALGVQRFLLDVRAGNIAAQKLYKNAGFEKIAVQKNFYDTPAEDGWLMELRIPQ